MRDRRDAHARLKDRKHHGHFDKFAAFHNLDPSKISDGEVLQWAARSADSFRFEFLQHVDAKGDVLSKYMPPLYVRATRGQSGLRVEGSKMGWTRITPQQCPIGYHNGLLASHDSIYNDGIRFLGNRKHDNDGMRGHIYFDCVNLLLAAHKDTVEAMRQDFQQRLQNPGSALSRSPRPYFPVPSTNPEDIGKRGGASYCIDNTLCEAMNKELQYEQHVEQTKIDSPMYQTGNNACVREDCVPPECLRMTIIPTTKRSFQALLTMK